MSEPKFRDGDWYRCRVGLNGKWEVGSGDKKNVFYEVEMLVVGGEMEGQSAPFRNYIIDKQQDRAIARFRMLGFDAVSQDLALLKGPDSPIAGKECWAQMQIQPKDANNLGKGYWPARFNEIDSLENRLPGGPEYKAAQLLGNTATKAPNPENFHDNF